MRASLIPLEGGDPISIDKDLLVVGRHATCDLRLDDKTVSKMHCVLVRADGMLLLRDLDSTNGCRVNDQRVSRTALLDNDVLAIASTRFRVRCHKDGEASNGIPVSERTEVINASDFARHLSKSRAGSGTGSNSTAPKPKREPPLSLSDIPLIPE